ncbi:conjugal transfer protein TraG [Devosia limi DSM 17137]|uniref:Conjugal transfer protein TraG n=2 Tax=Devosia TaxID=46913 RepID=A0A0F5LVE4_9HYPH|nr:MULTISPECIES: Ti-type conjugative transfer system protein TraG [Devosia]MBU1334374.1 Ti-type conjugative transfer system protein TraG [Alphaproteobacteria bacterium]KFL29763.1 conjugal transfer protein TraG [Devosia riboflavina]KKB86139.1 conjugal transfer protein TraG [Devosia limi DSM 17137]MBU1559718.1 Ti-type conjugative transfer system protein TraG [Alphaproteobacteria bacterium]MBU2305097.1 Ti-type conjugative transfer system protein TraG [Alphaproteobacteria bacterium]
MTLKKLTSVLMPILLMTTTVWMLTGIEQRMAGLGTTSSAQMLLGKLGIALPYATAAGLGVVILFASAGSTAIRYVGGGVASGATVAVAVAVWRELARLSSFADQVPFNAVLGFVDPSTTMGAMLALGAGLFGLRVVSRGNRAFSAKAPKRIEGRRAIHGSSNWMSQAETKRLFPSMGGVVIGERCRVDQDVVAERAFRADDKESWGVGGTSPLLCFDCAFGSTHGIAFAGSGGFKTTSVTIPTALKWGHGLVILDPSNEVAPMVREHRRAAQRTVVALDPSSPEIGFNALDWIGRFSGSKEEDIAAVASWIITEAPRAGSARDDFFRGAALQLLTALIADVCLSGHVDPAEQTLRRVRANMAEPEPKLRQRLQAIYDSSGSTFVKENVAPFINMTPETFSGVYASAAKETHWLSYENYAALVSGNTFSTDDLAAGTTDIFINLDLKTLENHPGLARVIIGALMNAIYNRNGKIEGRTLFLLDEVARLGFMRILETARDAGRKYGITLVLLFQSIGQMREAYGGRDATSKWFESASWMSFAAINDPETADYISKRCGDTTVEVSQVSTSTKSSGSSRTRSRQLSRRPLILPHEVLQMRADEQIVFTAGNPPIRCGRAIWFRRADMKSVVSKNRFHHEE